MEQNLLPPSTSTTSGQAHSNNYDEFFTEYLTIDGDNDDDDSMDNTTRDERCCICISLLDGYCGTVPCFTGYAVLRRSVWEVVSGRSSKYGSVTRYYPSLIFELIIFLLIVTNVVLSVLISEETYQQDLDFVSTYGTIEILSTFVFTLEYSLRLWSAPSGREKHVSRRSKRKNEVVNLQHGCCSSRLRWFLAPLSLLDLIVLIGFYVDYLSTNGAKQGLTAIRLFRLLSIFRFERQSKGLKHLGQVLKRKIPELILALFVAIILLMTSATIMYAVENEYPEFSSLSKALWWSSMTITTVGYGDVSPNTSTGRVIASIVAFMGLCLFALPSAVLGSGLIEVMTENRHAAFMERKRARRQRRQSYDPLRQTNRSGRMKIGGVGSNSSGGGGGGGGSGGGGGGGGGGAGERKSSFGAGTMGDGVELSSIRNERRTTSMDSEDLQSSGGSSGGIRFSDVFNVHNPSHLIAVSNLLLEDPGVMASFFSRYKSESGGLVGLHTAVTRRLAEAYLREHLEEEDDDEEEMLGSGGGGGGGSHHYLSSKNSSSSSGEDKFMKL